MRRWLATLLLLALAPSAHAGDVDASAPTSLSVTIYRAPYRAAGSIRLDHLGGFALVTETRTVHLPAGDSRLRFQGVVDGILPESAIVTGLPRGVIEKNRDAALLSPEALARAAVGSEITLVRTNRKTGKSIRVRATLRSANDQGAVFETADGVEAYRCSGLPESLQFDRVPTGLGPTPTLSALTRTRQPVTATVTLSYLAEGFDWAANYVARIHPDGKTLSLGAWITLANGNGVSLPRASTQIVAGRLNRAGALASPYAPAERIIARCWPQGTTSDTPERPGVRLVSPYGFGGDAQRRVRSVIYLARKNEAFPPPPLAIAPAPAPPPPPEQLGDLKLYRIPEATTVAARESKQVRLLDQSDVAFTRIATADLPPIGQSGFRPATVLLRTQNSLKNHLGLPLPSGEVAVFEHASADRELLIGQAGLRDTAVDEAVELTLGASPDVQVRQTRLTLSARAPEIVPLSPELALALRRGAVVEEVEITNARAAPTAFELRLQRLDGRRIAKADPPIAMKDGRPIFRLTLPANGALKVRYTVE